LGTGEQAAFEDRLHLVYWEIDPHQFHHLAERDINQAQLGQHGVTDGWMATEHPFTPENESEFQQKDTSMMP
jgi:hypothetical protein